MPKSRLARETEDTELSPETAAPETAAPERPTPLDGEAFLSANRDKRARYRAEAEAKAQAKADRVPRKLEEGRRGGRLRVAGSRKLFALIAGLSVLVVALGVATAWLAVEYRDADRRADDTAAASTSGPAAAVDAARRYAVELTTFDSADFDDLDRRIEAVSTPAFAQNYIAASQDARKGSAKAAMTSEANVAEAGVVSSTPDRVAVLIALNQVWKSPEIAKTSPQGQDYLSRVKVTVVRSGDRWLLDDFAVL